MTFRMQDKLWGAEGGSSCREERVFEGSDPQKAPPPYLFFLGRTEGGKKGREGGRKGKKEGREGRREGRNKKRKEGRRKGRREKKENPPPIPLSLMTLLSHSGSFP